MNVMVPVVEGKGTLFEDAGFEVKSADEITCNQIDTSESIMSALAHTTIESAKLSNSDKAISMVAEDGREEELRSFLESDLSLVENVKDWVCSSHFMF